VSRINLCAIREIIIAINYVTNAYLSFKFAIHEPRTLRNDVVHAYYAIR